MKEIIEAIKRFLNERFNLHEDRAEEAEIVGNIRKNVSFKGPNLWTLIFAIFIASIGLNVNSTAVIIGAMLISPLMGPIMGVGLAVAISDFELLKKGIQNIAIAAVISILTSALYFSITPLHDANSELLARTNPSLWDVFIAFFGGLAGIVAGTRTEKSNVIPGVAIATALMPPLCTAGFGLATGQWMFMLGAVYLFFINSLFICLSTFLIVKHLRFHKKEFHNSFREKRVMNYIYLMVIITVVPSIYLAYKIVERSIFETNAKNYVQREFSFPKTQVVNRSYHINERGKSIELLLVGEELTSQTLDSLQKKIIVYGLDTSTRLIIHQGLDAKQEIDIAQIRASILEDVFKADPRQDTIVARPSVTVLSIPNLSGEFKTLFPAMSRYALTRTVVYQLDSLRQDTLLQLTVKFNNRLAASERRRLEQWVKQRTGADSLRLVVE